jgi:tRNA pseudouridine55 synthase
MRDVRGVLLLDKPRGVTSNRALQQAKRLFQAEKAGHTGSLDPLATGMLPICFGAATRIAGFLLDARKTYRVLAELGAATATGDADGVIVERRAAPVRTTEQVASAIAQLTGVIEQVPPMYSALKREGIPLYRLARRGVEVPRAPRRVTIHWLTLERLEWPAIELTVGCSKGTYIRTLVTDLAAALGTVGYVRELRRVGVEPFRSDAMWTFDALEAALRAGGQAALDAALAPIDAALPDWPRVVLDAAAADRLLHGQAVAVAHDTPTGWTLVYGPSGMLIALGEVMASQVLAPRRVFGP